MKLTGHQRTKSEKAIGAFESAFTDSCGLDLKFENAPHYNSAFEYALCRTVCDVEALGKNLRVLDVGAFTGVISVALARLGYVVEACDVPFVISDPALSGLFESEGIKSYGVNLAAGKFPQGDESFDLIVFHSVLTHLNFNPIPLLREFSRLLSSGGRVYCATPNLLSAKNIALILKRKGYLNPIEHLVWNLQPETGMSVGLHWREWTREELIELFRVSGFDLASHRFDITTRNISKPYRKFLVSILYKLWPSLMPSQTAVFRKR
jgi:SAM-dependent methyltransferase